MGSSEGPQAAACGPSSFSPAGREAGRTPGGFPSRAADRARGPAPTPREADDEAPFGDRPAVLPPGRARRDRGRSAQQGDGAGRLERHRRATGPVRPVLRAAGPQHRGRLRPGPQPARADRRDHARGRGGHAGCRRRGAAGPRPGRGAGAGADRRGSDGERRRPDDPVAGPAARRRHRLDHAGRPWAGVQPRRCGPDHRDPAHRGPAAAQNLARTGRRAARRRCGARPGRQPPALCTAP